MNWGCPIAERVRRTRQDKPSWSRSYAVGGLAVPDEREALINRILETNRRAQHRYMQLGGDCLFAEVDLTMPQLKTLYTVVVGDGVSMSQLARTLGMTLSTATGVVDRLVSQGLVRRDGDPHDRRLVLLRPTEEGVALVDRLTQVGQAQLELIASRLNLEELALLARASDLMYRVILEVSREDLQTRCIR